jgi:hypothetical protein
VFPTGAGNVEHHANIVVRGLAPVQVAAGMTVPELDEHRKPVKDDEGKSIVAAKYTGLHALRHFYASWCINRKEDGGLGLPLEGGAAPVGALDHPNDGRHLRAPFPERRRWRRACGSRAGAVGLNR